MFKINNHLKNYIWVLTSMAIPFLTGIIAIPYIINKIGLTEFGLLSIFWAIISFIPIFDLGLSRRIIQKINSYNKKRKKIELKLLSNSIIIIIIYSLVIFIITLPVILFSIYIYDSGNLKVYIILVVLIPLILVTQIIKSFFEAINNFTMSSIVQSLNALSIFVGPILSIYLGKYELSSLLLFIGIFRLFIFILGLLYAFDLSSNNIFLYNKVYLKTLLKNSYNSSYSSATIPCFVLSERLTLNLSSNKNSSGEFAAGAEILSRIFSVIGILNTILFPTISKVASNSNRSSFNYLNNILFKVFLLSLPILIIILFFSENIAFYLYNNTDEKNYKLIIIFLSIGYFFNGFSQFLISYLYAHEKVSLITFTQYIELIFYIPFLYFMVINYNTLGASLSFLVRHFFDFLLLYLNIYYLYRKKVTS